MPLESIELPIDAPRFRRTPPPEVVSLLRDADEFVHNFVEDRLDDPIAGYVPCDFQLAYFALRHVVERRLMLGSTFCEWGSGLGIVSCLAACLDFDASGIEIEGELVEASTAFARDHEIVVELVQGSFIPPGSDDCLDDVGDFAWLLPGGHDGHALLDLDVDDIDVVFAYPWPGEEDIVFDLFNHHAAPGALLLTYHGMDSMRLQRKRRAKGRR